MVDGERVCSCSAVGHAIHYVEQADWTYSTECREFIYFSEFRSWEILLTTSFSLRKYSTTSFTRLIHIRYPFHFLYFFLFSGSKVNLKPPVRPKRPGLQPWSKLFLKNIWSEIWMMPLSQCSWHKITLSGSYWRPFEAWDGSFESLGHNSKSDRADFRNSSKS